MTTNRCPPWGAGWIMSILASLFMTLIPWLGGGDQGHVAEAQRDITVHQGRLSVHLIDADVRDVLTAIAQQAGITIHADLRAGIRVSTHFSGMVLDEGLRHLLRRASLSSTMVYTRGPARAVMLTAVYVFEEATGPASNPQLAAELPAQNDREEGGTSFAEALAQLSSTAPPLAEGGKSDGSANFRALLESAQHAASPLGAGEESPLARRLREALEQR
jgi:hypothetical protein